MEVVSDRWKSAGEMLRRGVLVATTRGRSLMRALRRCWSSLPVKPGVRSLGGHERAHRTWRERVPYVAVVLLVLAALTPGLINGLQAKYVSGAATGESARVARFGLVPKTEGELFNVDLCPGAGNTTGMKLSLAGTAEVSVRAHASLTYSGDDYGELCLPKGSYAVNWTSRTVSYSANGTGITPTFTLGSDHYPLRYAVKNASGTTVQSNLTVAQLKTWLEGNAFTSTLAPNQAASSLGSYTITWSWPQGTTVYEKADQVLLHADELTWTNKPAGLCTTEKLGWDVITVQVD